MEQRQHALLRGRCEISFEPRFLGRADAGRDVGIVAVQRNHVPGAQVVAVVAFGGIAGLRAPVPEVPRRGSARVVVAVAGDGVGAGFVPAPTRPVAVLVAGERAAIVGPVAHGEHAARDRVQQRRGSFVVGAVAARDVAGPGEGDDGRGRGDGDRCDAHTRCAVLVGYRHAHRARAGRGVGVRRGDGARLARCAPHGLERAVPPIDCVGPSSVVHARVAERGGERDGRANRGGLIGARIH